MNRAIKTLLCVLCAGIPAIYACSQVPPPPPANPVIGGPAGPGAPGDRVIRQLLTIQGNIAAYVANDRNEYDGFTLKNSGQAIDVRFAPHNGSALMEAAKTGAAVSVQGFYETTPEGRNVLHLVNLTVGSRTIYDLPPPVPATSPTVTIQPFSGTITDLRRDALGNTNGILLSGNRIIEMSPGIFDQLQANLKPGVVLSGSGSPITPPAGVVLAQNIQAIHPQTLTLNGQTYIVR